MLKARYWEGANVYFPPLSSFAPRQLLLTATLVIWTVRLGSFLVQVTRYGCSLCDVAPGYPLQRAIMAGGDSLFDEVKH
jgi:hypothetical protein